MLISEALLFWDTNMGHLEDKYFVKNAGELSLLPPINIDLERTSLVIIDMQYLDAHQDHGVVAALEKIHPGSTEYYSKRLNTSVPAIKSLLEYARTSKMRVIHIVVGSKYKDLRDFNKRMRHWIFELQDLSGIEDIYWTESPTFKVLEELTPGPGETIIRKPSYGAVNSTNIENKEERRIASYRLIAKMPTIAAMAYKFSIGQPFVYPNNKLNYSENFLNMLFSVPAEEYKINNVFSDALDKILILHADHEQNASTSTVRLAGSSGASPLIVLENMKWRVD